MENTKQLSKKQEQVLRFIVSYQDKNQKPPTLEEIADYLDVTTPTAHQHVHALADKGFITTNKNQPRSIQVNPSVLEKEGMKPQFLTVPVLGAANAGPALLNAEEYLQGYLRVPRSKLQNTKDIFAIQIEGDSMNKADINGKNIENGDFVLIDTDDKDIKDGDYVLSVIDGSGTVKKFIRDRSSGTIELRPESTNPKHKPIFISSKDEFIINGKVIDVIKK